MIEFLTEVFKMIPPRDIILGLLVVGLMLLNWYKDRLISKLNNTTRDLSNDISILSELLRTLVYGRAGHRDE
jgi:hypothetical protein